LFRTENAYRQLNRNSFTEQERPSVPAQPHQPFGQSSPAAASLLRWARTSESSALAVLRAGGYVLRYPLFDALDQATRGGLRWLSGPWSEQRYQGLAELALREGQQLLRSGQRRSCVRFVRDDGKGVLEVRLERLPRHDGDLAVVIAHPTAARPTDVDPEKMRREERLQAVGVVVSGVAHDLNHALNVIALRLARLQQDPALASVHSYLESLERVADDAAATVARLQDLARRRREAPTVSLELTRAIDAAVEAVRSEIEQTYLIGEKPVGRPAIDGTPPRAPVRIEAELPRLPPVRGSATEVSHVFLDLILTARDAMPQGGVVRVAAHAEGDHAVATVEDEGPGVPEKHLLRVFDPFFTLSASRDTGMGLSLAAEVVDRLGGSISVGNRAQGGTIYTLTFPFARAEAAPPPRSAAPRTARALRVLLVDDEVDNLEVLREVLSADGHLVSCAQSGRAALDLLRDEGEFDLVLCDVGMPGMSGWQLVREAKQLKPDLCIYMLTGWAREIAAEDPHQTLVRGVLGKPLDLDRLRWLLAEVSAKGADPAARPRP
jgi:signal transduction histidine kinase/ActR/RegA family two-component response regulator